MDGCFTPEIWIADSPNPVRSNLRFILEDTIHIHYSKLWQWMGYRETVGMLQHWCDLFLPSAV